MIDKNVLLTAWHYYKKCQIKFSNKVYIINLRVLDGFSNSYSISASQGKIPFWKSSIVICFLRGLTLLLNISISLTALAFSLVNTQRNLVRALQDSNFQIRYNSDFKQIGFFKCTSLGRDKNRNILHLNKETLDVSL